MLSRYTRPEMAELWSEETKFALWLELATLAVEVMAELGTVPPEAAEAIRAKGAVDPVRIAELESELRHDVLAFLTSVAEQVGPAGRYLHRGLTSSDLVDSALAIRLVKAADLLIAGVDGVLEALRSRAFEHKFTPMIGRSHGVHAEPITFGLKLAGFYAEFVRVRRRLVAARAEIATCAFSGAVGTYAEIDPEVEERLAARLGLAVEPMSTQIIARDRHAAFFAALGVAASSIERLAVEIRHLQRTEVLEAEERFSAGQKGSSAMPHKRNPILSENLTGLARLVRSAVGPALENVALWHERDISHSSVERAIAPDATAHLDFALHRLAGLVRDLVVHPDHMRANLDRLGGLIHSQAVMLALTETGLPREEAYRLTQRAAMRVWRGEKTGPDAFRAALAEDPEIASRLSSERLAPLFDFRRHFQHVERIFARVFTAADEA